MNRLFSFMLLIAFLVVPQGLFAQEVPQEWITDDDLLDVFSMTKDDVSLLLTRGSLKTYVGVDVDGVSRSARDMIWNAAQEFHLNPRFLLVLLQREQSLIEDDHPTMDQLDWAMGYGICDDCSKTDPLIQKFKGFGNQVYFAAKRIRESYLTDLLARGFTESGIGPGREVMIDGQLVVPLNMAMAVLYTYTPHQNGNENFLRIWNRWFARPYLDGTLLQDKTTGGIWLIQHSLRRPVTSRAAFFSRFNSQQLIAVGPSVLSKYAIGKAITFPNYSLVRSPAGTVYLLVADERRGFVSQAAFAAMGFSADEIIDVDSSELEAYREGPHIETTTVYAKGILLQDQKTGGVFFVQDGVKHPIMSREILAANFSHPVMKAVRTQELEVYTTSSPQLFPNGTLIGSRGSPDIFVVSNGLRHPIVNEETFLTFGWRWDQIIWTNERSVLIHELGEVVDVTS